MAVDNFTNFAYSTVATAPVPATTGTSLVVQAGDGAKFPSGQFDLLMWPPDVLPVTGNAEIARATVTSDTMTITRHQYGTSAQSVATGWQVAAALTANFISEIINLIPVSFVASFNSRTGGVTLSKADIEGLFSAVGEMAIGTGSGTGAYRQLLNEVSVTTNHTPDPLELSVVSQAVTVSCPNTSGAFGVIVNEGGGAVVVNGGVHTTLSQLGFTGITLYQQGDMAFWFSDGSIVYIAAILVNPARLPVITTSQPSSYTFVLSDAGTVVEYNSSSPGTFTVPTNASVPFPIGTIIEGCEIGSGVLTFAGAGGVTIDSPSGLTVIKNQFGTASIRKRGTNEWLITGDI